MKTVHKSNVVFPSKGVLTINHNSGSSNGRRGWKKPEQSKQPDVLSRHERFWFAIGSLLFGIYGYPVAHRPLLKAPPASEKVVVIANTHEDRKEKTNVYRS